MTRSVLGEKPLGMDMTLVSLFAGIGGFDLAFQRAGFAHAGMCEIDPHAMSVLNRHWPDVPKHDDVTTLKATTFGPADVITFGSPCQDLSVAGKRAGLDGERSGLFLEAVRYIREMLEETNGRYPRWAVWENVVGAFSSSGGDDFAAVLESLVGGEVRRPPSGWAYAGVAFGPLGAAEWRVLDSQHFGVAQRRRRVFVVYHPGSERAGQVLLEPQSVRGHTPQGREAREGTPPASQARPGSSGAAWGLSGEFNAALDLQPTLQHDSPSGGGQKPMVGVPVANALTAREGKGPDSDATTTLVPVAFKVRGGKEGGGKGYLGSEDVALTISTVQEQYLAEPLAFRQKAAATAGLSEGPLAPTLEAATPAHTVAFPIQDGRDMAKAQNGLGIGNPSDPSYTVDTTGAQAVAFVASDYSTGAYEPADKAEALTTSADRTRAAPIAFALGGREDGATPATPYAVRRLTPKECCRLQGFPDEWTRYAADGTEIADTHRYRMMGNAVSVPVAEWIAQRLKRAIS